MGSHNSNTSLNFFESLAAVGVLGELEGHLEIYAKLLSGQDDIDLFSGMDDIGENNGREEDENKIAMPEEDDSTFHDMIQSLVSRRSTLTTEKKTASAAGSSTREKKLSDTEKMLEDLNFLIETVSATKSELDYENTFKKLESSLKEEEDRQNEESILREKLHLAEDQVMKLEKEIAQFEKESSEKWKEQMCHLNNLKDQLHLAKQQGDEEERFAKVWLTARNDEKGLRQKDEISTKRSSIGSIETQINRDCVAYENVTSWTKLVSAQLHQKIRDWKEKFATDVQDIEKKIEFKKKIIQHQHESIESLQTTIDERMAELAPWEEEKAQERLDRLEHMRRYYSCRKIQRWWRKYMISHGLYRKKKQKPKAKGKNRSKSKSISSTSKASTSNR